ncbi:class I SAM-dependent methyltransferase [Brachybacterium paraconglomeratum]
MQQRSADRDFAAYNEAQDGRTVRPLAVRAAQLVLEEPGRSLRTAPDDRLVAVELGSGAGIEARHLADSGFRVHTFDADVSVEAGMARMARTLDITHTTTDLAVPFPIPPADLVLSCATLSFVPRAAFPQLWGAVRSALRPHGVLAVDLFGDRDDWAGTDGTFLTRADLEELLTGLEVLALDEEEHDGRSFAGPKHWHTYRLIVREPRDIAGTV